MADSHRHSSFWALFIVQLLGALGGNLFKNCLLFTIAYRSLTLCGLNNSALVPLCSGLFILPYFFFSGLAGQMADRFSKKKLVVWLKIYELCCIILALYALWLLNLPLLLGTLFLLGLQAALFGPVKYSILPELVTENWLLPANAHIESGTFIAILLGTIGGGLLAASGDNFFIYTAFALGLNSVCGLLSSLAIKDLPPVRPDLKLDFNPWPALVDSYRTTRDIPAISRAILLISWFWFIGAAIMALLPVLGSNVLQVSEHVITVFLAIFCLGIGAGTALCQHWCRRYHNYGLIPPAAMLMGLAIVAAGFTIRHGPSNTTILIVLGGELFLIALSGGLFTVPLYTLMQSAAPTAARSRVIAANNVFNSLFMVAATALLLLFDFWQISSAWQLIILGLLQCVVALICFKKLIAEFDLLLCRILANLGYKLEIRGMEKLPPHGPAVFISNHTTFIDWLFITALCPTPPIFVMYKDYFFGNPLVKAMLEGARALPIASSYEDPELLAKTFAGISKYLQQGEIIGFFPEGKLTRDGHMNEFKTGIERIIAKDPCPVYPMGIKGLWGSFFSRHPRPYRWHWGRRTITINIGDPVPPDILTATGLQQKVAELLNEQ